MATGRYMDRHAQLLAHRASSRCVCHLRLSVYHQFCVSALHITLHQDALQHTVTNTQFGAQPKKGHLPIARVLVTVTVLLFSFRNKVMR